MGDATLDFFLLITIFIRVGHHVLTAIDVREGPFTLHLLTFGESILTVPLLVPNKFHLSPIDVRNPRTPDSWHRRVMVVLGHFWLVIASHGRPVNVAHRVLGVITPLVGCNPIPRDQPGCPTVETNRLRACSVLMESPLLTAVEEHALLTRLLKNHSEHLA